MISIAALALVVALMAWTEFLNFKRYKLELEHGH